MLPHECRAGLSLGAGRVRARVSVGFGVAYISGGESQESGCYHPDASGDKSSTAGVNGWREEIRQGRAVSRIGGGCMDPLIANIQNR